MFSVIVLNYKNVQMTAQCVRGALDSAQGAGVDIEVIVVDNSAPETARQLRELLPPTVSIIENSRNLGFAKANNQGIEASKGDFLLLLNNDCFINPDALRKGIDVLSSRPRVGVWAPALVGQDGQFQASCARFPSLKGLAGEYLFSCHPDWYREVSRWAEPTEVDTVVGAFFLTRRDVVEQVGLLDEDFFFTVEDVDYCRRVRDSGYSVVHDPRCSVVHLGSFSQKHDGFICDPYLHRYRIHYFRKHGGSCVALLASAIIGLGLFLRRLKKWLRLGFRQLSIL